MSALMRHTEALHGKKQVLQGVQAWERVRQQGRILTNGSTSNCDEEVYIDSDAYCESTGTWDCAICGREFNTIKALTQHANSGIHSENSYHCDDCGKQFKALASLYSHVDATSCKHVRHIANTLGSDYQQGNNFLKLTNGSAQEAILFFDGAAKPNPGRGGAGFVLFDAHGRLLEQRSIDIIKHRNCTSNQAEYCGLILGLECAQEFHIRSLLVKGDSQLVVNQMNGAWNVKSQNLFELFNCANRWEDTFRKVDFMWIPRDENYEADELAKMGSRRDGEVEQRMSDIIASM